MGCKLGDGFPGQNRIDRVFGKSYSDRYRTGSHLWKDLFGQQRTGKAISLAIPGQIKDLLLASLAATGK